MGKFYNRDWLQSYKVNPREDRAVYKNYQNPSMTQWEREMGGLSPAQKERYEGFITNVPDELRGLSAIEMQKYMQNVQQRQNLLEQEKQSYDVQKQNLIRQQKIAPSFKPTSNVNTNQNLIDKLKSDLAHKEYKLIRAQENSDRLHTDLRKNYKDPFKIYGGAPENVMTTLNNAWAERDSLIPEIQNLRKQLYQTDPYWDKSPQEAARLRSEYWQQNQQKMIDRVKRIFPR